MKTYRDSLDPYPEPVDSRPKQGNWQWTGRGWRNLDYVSTGKQHKAWCLYNSTYAHLDRCTCEMDEIEIYTNPNVVIPSGSIAI